MELGYPNPQQMLREMGGSRQLTEWMAYFRAYPPEELDNQRFGVIAASIYNTTPRDKGNRKVYEPTDFFPSLVPAPPPSAEDLLQKVVGINQQMKGLDQRPGRERKAPN